jgi:hypothetical protein
VNGAEQADHAEEALQALSASEWQRQKWGDADTGRKDDLRSALWEMEHAKVHALLHLADRLDALLSALPETSPLLRGVE